MARLARLVLALAAGLACACGSGPAGTPLAPGARPAKPAIGLRPRPPTSTRALAYATDLSANGRVWVAVELGTAFELVVRAVGHPGGGSADDRMVTERLRVHLGPAEADVPDVELGPDARFAWIASEAGTVRAVDLETGRVAVTWRAGSPVTAVAVSPDGTLAALGTATGVLCLRRTRDGALLQCATAHDARISGLNFGAGGRLVSGSWDGTAAVWTTPALASVTRRAGGPVSAVALCPDGPGLAVARGSRAPARTPADAARAARGDSADPRAHAVVVGAAGARRLRGHRGPIPAITWVPGCERLLTGSWDRTVRLWSAGGRELARTAPLGYLVRDVAVDGRGATAAVAAWDAAGGAPASVLVDLLYAD